MSATSASAASHTAPAPDSTSMTPLERRASGTLASIYALRMLGLFLVLPVFALEAHKYPGGDDPALIGLAMGIYGLTQGALQLPFGLASDRLGRKRTIVFGLLVFAAGSFMAAAATSLTWLIAGRALQGAGAVSAAVTALLADQTRDEVRTKAMALVSASIGLMFALSLVLAPILSAKWGLQGLFVITGVLALTGIAVMLWLVPAEPPRRPAPPRGRLMQVLLHGPTLRLNFGVFALHAVLLAMWVAIPGMLVDAGLPRDHHWWVYLPAVAGSFVVMGVTLFPMERRGLLRPVFLGAFGLVTLVQVGLALMSGGVPGIAALSVALFVFFCGSNVLEACQPSIASRLAPADARGAAMGLYNTLQSLGFFAGGALGGVLVKFGGAPALFGVTALLCAACIWASWRLPGLSPAVSAAPAQAGPSDASQSSTAL